MASENNFQSKVESLFKGMDGYIHSEDSRRRCNHRR